MQSKKSMKYISTVLMTYQQKHRGKNLTDDDQKD